ncbi:hypothetical protein OROHE_020507 [Orobanche hederae]
MVKKAEIKFVAFVRGLDTRVEENEMKTALKVRFEGCGNITNISVPIGDNGLKGFAYIDFTGHDALTKALEFDHTTLGNRKIEVLEASPDDKRPSAK